MQKGGMLPWPGLLALAAGGRALSILKQWSIETKPVARRIDVNFRCKNREWRQRKARQRQRQAIAALLH